MNAIELLQKQKVVYVKNFISQDLTKFFTNVLIRNGVILLSSHFLQGMAALRGCKYRFFKKKDPKFLGFESFNFD